MSRISCLAFCLLASSACASFFYYSSFVNENMEHIKFDLGKNIVETARMSGVPKFTARDIEGYVSYSTNGIPKELPAVFDRPPYRVSFAPLFAFTMYADVSNKNNLAVHNVTLQFDTREFQSHEYAQSFVSNLTQQMAKAGWLRYISEDCPAVSGRSTLLDKDGVLDPMPGCPLDPVYRIHPSEWTAVMASEQSYQWTADGILAKLRISFSEGKNEILYRVFMEFDEATVKNRRDKEFLIRDLAAGDQKGWKSNEKYARRQKEEAMLIKNLETNAELRGDLVLKRQ